MVSSYIGNRKHNLLTITVSLAWNCRLLKQFEATPNTWKLTVNIAKKITNIT